MTGDRPRGQRIASRINDRYTKATLRDADLHGVFLRVLNLQERPEMMARLDNLIRAYMASGRPAPAIS